MPGNGAAADPGKDSNPQPGTTAGACFTACGETGTTPARLAFYGRTNQRGRRALDELARQLRQCRTAIAGRDAVITLTYYDLPETGAELPAPGCTAPGGLSRAGGWDALAAAMETPASLRGFDAVICTAADRISRRAPVLIAREELARRLGAPILCADELALPGGQYRSVIRRLLISPAPDARAPLAAMRPMRLRGPRPFTRARSSTPAHGDCPEAQPDDDG